MIQPSPSRLFGVLDATWPAARYLSVGPWRIREGCGGGQRVSAATAEDVWEPADIAVAEREMRALDQRPLFMLREDDKALDEELSMHGYTVADPTTIFVSPVRDITAALPITAAMPSWPPLAIQIELWAASGIGPARLAVMERSACPKTSVLGRSGDIPAGTAYVAAHGDIAMVHAIEVAPEMRRKGVGRRIMQACANWAEGVGADWLSLAVTRANDPAQALYRAFGMAEVTNYHYRRAPEGAE